MTEVVFGKYEFRVEKKEEGQYIFDPMRKKYVALTPEEWVRQHILHYLTENLSYPKSLIAVERGLKVNDLQKRFDVLVFDQKGTPKMIVECKAPDEVLNENVLEQIISYNLSLKVRYLWVTNGRLNFCWRLSDKIELLQSVPAHASP